MIDEPGLAAERERDQGPGHVAHVDEIAPGLEVAGDQGNRIGAGGQQLGGEFAEGLRGGEAGPDRVEQAGDDHLQRRPLGQAGDRGQPLAPAVGVDRTARISLGDRQVAPAAPARAPRPSPPG